MGETGKEAHGTSMGLTIAEVVVDDCRGGCRAARWTSRFVMVDFAFACVAFDSRSGRLRSLQVAESLRLLELVSALVSIASSATIGSTGTGSAAIVAPIAAVVAVAVVHGSTEVTGG